MKVEEGLFVELDYVLVDEDGAVVEASADEGPMLYVHGAGQVPPALEQALLGAEVGAKVEVTLEPEEAFGTYDPEGVVSVPRSEFPPEAELEIDEWIEICIVPEEGDEEPHEEGEMQARVVELDAETVVLDTNPPLAGRRVTFRVEVRDVRQPSPDDLKRLEELEA